MVAWDSQIVDVKGAFLLGEFEQNEQIYMEIPEGFEQFYDADCLLLLLKTLYGLKQADMAFWKKLLAAMRNMGFEKSCAYLCLYFEWTALGLVVWLSWIDNCLCMGAPEAVEKAKQNFMNKFDATDEGELREYVGCKITKNMGKRWLNFTQPVLLQSFADEFKINNMKDYNTLMEANKTLEKAEPEQFQGSKVQTYFRKGVGKLLHLMRWSRPEVMNPVRELSRQMTNPVGNHFKAMHRVMKYCVVNPERGWTLKPQGT